MSALGQRTIPYVYMGARFVGGLQELEAAWRSDELDRLITQLSPDPNRGSAPSSEEDTP